HEQLDVAVAIGARDVESPRATLRGLAEDLVDELEPDVAGLAGADAVELDDRPLVANGIPLDADQAGPPTGLPRGVPQGLRMERGRKHVPLADRHDPAVVEAGEHVNVGADVIDDRGPDEDTVDRLVAEDRDGQIGLERVELAAEGVALDAHVEERQDRRLTAD